jgi:hypothetical protein
MHQSPGTAMALKAAAMAGALITRFRSELSSVPIPQM